MDILALPGWIRAAVAVLFGGSPTLEPPMIIDVTVPPMFVSAAVDAMTIEVYEPMIMDITILPMFVEAEQDDMEI